MMEAIISIQPFGFDRVFRFAASEDKGPPRQSELLEQIAALQERIEALQHAQHAQQAALETAHSEGVAAGLAQARGERAEAMLGATDAVHASLDELDRQLAGVEERVMREAAEVALCAADMLAGHALSRDPCRGIDEALGRVLKQVARGTGVHIRVHPESRQELERLVEQRRAGERRALSITIADDPEIAPNDAHISWAEGGLFVDAAARRAAVERELGSLIEVPGGA